MGGIVTPKVEDQQSHSALAVVRAPDFSIEKERGKKKHTHTQAPLWPRVPRSRVKVHLWSAAAVAPRPFCGLLVRRHGVSFEAAAVVACILGQFASSLLWPGEWRLLPNP